MYLSMAPLHKICVWTQIRKIKRKFINARFWLVKNKFAFDFYDLRSNANFMQRGLYQWCNYTMRLKILQMEKESPQINISKYGQEILIPCG